MAVNPIFQRLTLLTGTEAMETLENTQVIVFGVGGVGSWCAEALVRSGVGSIAIVDSDTVCVTNINRQVQATAATVGEFKVDVLKKRLLEINPRCVVTAYGKVFSAENAASFGIEGADYAIDAIDSLTNKLDLIEYCARAGTPLYSSMGWPKNSTQPGSKPRTSGTPKAAPWPGSCGTACGSGAFGDTSPWSTVPNGFPQAKGSALPAAPRSVSAPAGTTAIRGPPRNGAVQKK